MTITSAKSGPYRARARASNSYGGDRTTRGCPWSALVTVATLRSWMSLPLVSAPFVLANSSLT